MVGLARRWAHPVGVGLVGAVWLFSAYVFLVLATSVRTFGFDAYAYWSVSLPDTYSIDHGALGSFNYGPPIALVADRFDALEWWVFLWLWTALLLGTVAWISGSAGWTIVALSLPFVVVELYHGNIHILLAAAVVLGFRHPWAWSFVLLTKPTAGVGLLWFAVRREWRQLGVALGATAALSIVAFVVAPSLWSDYLEALQARVGSPPNTASVPIPLALRLPVAIVLVTWGALTDRRWTVVVATMLALPVLWIGAGAMLIALIPEVRRAVGLRLPSQAASPASRSAS